MAPPRRRPGLTALVAGLVVLALAGLGVRALPALAQNGGLFATPAAETAEPAPAAPAVTDDPATPDPSTTPSWAQTDAQRAQAAKKARAKAAAEKKAAAKKRAAAAIPATGPGTYDYSSASAPAPSGRGTLRRFDVRVEDGLDIDPERAARLMAAVLNDERSWRGSGRWRFELVQAGQKADLHASIVTPGTTDELCAPLLTRGEVSCQNGNRVVLNAKRWAKGVRYYGGDVDGYRRYLINHEFGHALGHDHVRCPGRGQLAPVMMQQTKGLGGCRKNPWPQPAND